jgi:excisionase family DNA binding protein
MSRKPILTTFEAATICHVSYNTIKNWIKRGLLSAYRTAGGHLRIKTEDLDKFSREYGVELYDKGDTTTRKVLIIDRDDSFCRLFQDAFSHLGAGISTHFTSDMFEAGVHAEQTKPDLIIVGNAMPYFDAVKVAGRIHRTPTLKSAKIAVVMDSGDVKLDIPTAIGLSRAIDKVGILETFEPVLSTKKGVRGKRKK